MNFEVTQEKEGISEIKIDKKPSKNNFSSHSFVTGIFNICFNDIISKFGKKGRIIGKMKGARHDIVYREIGNYYDQASELSEIREQITDKKEIDKTVLKKIIKRISKVYIDSGMHPEFNKAIVKFLEKIDGEYKLDFSTFFKRQNDSYKKKKKEEQKNFQFQKKANNMSSESENTSYRPKTKSVKTLNLIIKRIVLILGILLLCFSFLFVGYIYFNNNIQTENNEFIPNQNFSENNIVSKEDFIEEKEEIVLERKSINDQIGDEIKNFDEVQVKGYLSLEKSSGDKSLYITALIDDYGNMIELRDVKSDIYDLFPKDETTEKVYIVKGQYIKGNDNEYVRVNSVTENGIINDFN
ncbi:hypothetical protein GF327_01585 [Candidatus Woesearchaeota archaeon]|nr:hypothetical protein [Candidatus Woesearchaeota archaeon]